MSQVAIREDKTSINAVAFGRTDSGAGLAPQNLGDIVRFAEVMSRADIAIPKHLRDNPGACLAVCMQAFKWEMDPFACAQKSYKVGDQMAYEAQLIAAVINTRAGLKKRPQIEFQGEGSDRKCIVTFHADDGSVHVYESPRVGAITTKNSPLWKSDPDQQLGYYSIRAGARRHFPEVILGVYDRDEIAAARDVTPPADRPSLGDRLAQAKADRSPDAREGFNHSVIDGELRGSQEAPAADIEGNAASTEDASEAEVVGTAPDSEAPVAPPAGESGENGATDPKEGTSLHTMLDALREPADVDPADEREEPTITEADRRTLARCAGDLFGMATGPEDVLVRKARILKGAGVWGTSFADMSDETKDMARAIVRSAHAINHGDTSVESAAGYFSDMLALPLADVMPAGGSNG